MNISDINNISINKSPRKKSYFSNKNKNNDNNNNNNNNNYNYIDNFIDNKDYNTTNQIGKKLKILKNLDDIENKIKFGLIKVVPEKSFLNINENKYLNYKDIKNEVKKKEKEIKSNLQKSIDRNQRYLTSFQKNELDRIYLKEKIKNKKENINIQENLLKSFMKIEDVNLNEKKDLLLYQSK
jgi:hypothetical protein